jgi:hypothetical protein
MSQLCPSPFLHVALIAGLLAGGTPEARAVNGCTDGALHAVRALANAQHASPEEIAEMTEAVLGRPLKPTERVRLIAAFQARPVEGTSSRVRKIFSENEAALLDRYGVTADSVRAVTSRFATQEVPLTALGPKELKAVRKGKTYHYFVDLDGHLHLSETPLTAPRSELWVIRDSQTGQNYVAKEAGKLHINPTGEKPVLTKKWETELGDDPQELIARIKKENPEIEVSRPHLPEQNVTKAMSCADFTNARSTSNLRIFLEQWALSSLYEAGGIVVASYAIDPFTLDEETGQPKEPRLHTEPGRAIAASDLAITNIGAVLGGALYTGVSKAKLGFAGYLLISTLTSLGMPYISQETREAIVDPAYLNANDSEKLVEWDKLYGLIRIPLSASFQYFMRNKLPLLIFDSCRKGAKLKIYQNSKILKISEESGLTLLFYGGRAAMTGK